MKENGLGWVFNMVGSGHPYICADEGECRLMKTEQTNVSKIHYNSFKIETAHIPTG